MTNSLPIGFKVNSERPDILMEFNSENTKVYMNETADHYLLMSPIKAPCMTITYKDFKNETHVIEGVVYAYVEDYKQ